MRINWVYRTEWAKTDFINGGERDFDYPNFYKECGVSEILNAALAAAEAFKKDDPRVAKRKIGIKNAQIWFSEGMGVGSVPVKIVRIKFHTVFTFCRLTHRYMPFLKEHFDEMFRGFDSTFLSGTLQKNNE